MHTEETLFYIPIYRQTEEQYYIDIKKDFEKDDKSILKEVTDEKYLKYFYDDKVRENRYQRWAESENISNWELNQIIGWMEFYVHASKIKANLWFIKAKRIEKRPKNKEIAFRGRLGEVVDILDIKKSELLPKILEFTDEVRKGECGYKYLTKYYIPDKLFLPNTMISDLNLLFTSIKGSITSTSKRPRR